MTKTKMIELLTTAVNEKDWTNVQKVLADLQTVTPAALKRSSEAAVKRFYKQSLKAAKCSQAVNKAKGVHKFEDGYLLTDNATAVVLKNRPDESIPDGDPAFIAKTEKYFKEWFTGVNRLHETMPVNKTDMTDEVTKFPFNDQIITLDTARILDACKMVGHDAPAIMIRVRPMDKGYYTYISGPFGTALVLSCIDRR